MKKKVVLFLTVLTLTALPTSVFAQSVTSYNPLKNVFNQKYSPLAYESKSGVLPSSGEVEYSIDYSSEDGAHLRVYLGDDDKKGMKLVVYDPSNKVFASGETKSSNSYQVTLETKPTKEGTYRIKIVSNDGDGGWDYGYTSAARVY
ncbi:hypothetical protein [Paenibacillus sp. NAIST15-1]|uniref:hypothetical protein n=1 Tax=Paenibacillus sp. NAIST15-1 TaxID=1605994 RepID=UPI00086CB589|nr:hypothetical protein [Paenibacillus sp. NAIST15-1]GAV11318.1 hypothetical protein PBN151_1245 [Paenibacillus sp. NAIST15-1]